METCFTTVCTSVPQYLSTLASVRGDGELLYQCNMVTLTGESCFTSVPVPLSPLHPKIPTTALNPKTLHCFALHGTALHCAAVYYTALH